MNPGMAAAGAGGAVLLSVQTRRLERFGSAEHTGDSEIYYTFYADGALLGKSAVDVTTKRTLLARLQQLTEEVEAHGWDRARRARLVNIGRQAFTLVVPAQVRRTVFGGDGPAEIALDVQDHDIPWELLHDERGFLAERYAIGRKVLGPGRDPQQDRRAVRVVVVGDPTGQLEGARRESDTVSRHCRGALAKLEEAYEIPGEVIHLQGQAATKDSVLLDLLMNSEETIDLFHFAGHAYSNPLDPDEAGLRLADGNLRVFEAQSLGSSPLVFVNGCRAGQPDDSSLTFGAISGFAGQFVAGGALGYVAPMWPVGDRVAAELATAFYGLLIDGQPIGRALLEAKRAVEDPDALAYVFYGEVGERLPLFTPQLTSGPFVNDLGIQRIIATEREYPALELLAVNDLPWILWDAPDILSWTSRLPIDELRRGAVTQSLLEYTAEFGRRIKSGEKRFLCIVNGRVLARYAAARGAERWRRLMEVLDAYCDLPNFTLIVALPESAEIEEIELVSRVAQIPPSPAESVYVFNKQTRFEQSHLTYNLFEDYNPRMIDYYWRRFEELLDSSLAEYRGLDGLEPYSESFSSAVNAATRERLHLAMAAPEP